MKLNISIPEYEKYSVKYGYESIERSKAKFDSLPFCIEQTLELQR